MAKQPDISLSTLFFDLQHDEEPDAPECKGQVYRCHREYYIGSRGEYVEKVKMVPAKRLSCRGCEQCGSLLDDLQEWVGNDTPPIMPDDPYSDGEYFRLAVTNINRDWESGMVDDWDLEFVKIKK